MSDKSCKFVVLKFGGTSVARAEYWATIHKTLNSRLAEGLRPVVVCSALAGVTDALARIPKALESGDPARGIVEGIHETHHRLADALGLRDRIGLEQRLDWLTLLVASQKRGSEIDAAACAEIIGQGELLSSRLGCDWLCEQGLAANWQDAREWLVSRRVPGACRRQEFLSAVCTHDSDPRFRNDLLRAASVVVTQGFIARNAQRQTVLLGRGGSDTAAAYIAAKLGAQALEIWTDVPGVFTADPRQIPGAQLLRRLSYDESEIFARHGAKVLHPRCVEPLRRQGIPLSIEWTERPDFKGTRIDASGGARGAKGVSTRKGIYLVTMERDSSTPPDLFMTQVASCFEACGVSGEFTPSFPNRVQTVIDASLTPEIELRIEELRARLGSICRSTVRADVTAVSLVGSDVCASTEELASFDGLLADLPVLLSTRAVDDLSVTFVVPETEAAGVIQALHDALVGAAFLAGTLGPSWSQLAGNTPENRTDAVSTQAVGAV